MKDTAVIICAAGASARFGGDRKKPFVEVAGRAAFQRSIDFFAGREDVKQIIMAISPDDDELVRLKWGASLGFNSVKLCHGGSERFETVAGAMELVDKSIEFIAVHDAVRCCLKDEWVDRVFAKAWQSGAAILACPVISTLKRVTDGRIVETVDRNELYQAQTPQVFEAALLKKAYERLKTLPPDQRKKISDDSALVEALGHEVAIVPTDDSNIKITIKADVMIAEGIIKSRPKPKSEGPAGPFIEAQW